MTGLEHENEPLFSDNCRICGGFIGWISCPTGGWWAHRDHPADHHDAVPAGESWGARAVALLQRLADYYEGTDAPLGEEARQLLQEVPEYLASPFAAPDPDGKGVDA